MLLISSRKIDARVCGLEPSGPVVDRAGERALDVPEELAFQQAFGQGPAVDADVGARRSRAEVVDGARDQFLAGSGLAHDQDAGARRRDLSGRAEDLAHGRAFTEDAGQVHTQRGILAGPRSRGVRVEAGSGVDGHGRVTFTETRSIC